MTSLTSLAIFVLTRPCYFSLICFYILINVGERGGFYHRIRDKYKEAYWLVRLSPDVYSIGKWKHRDRQSPLPPPRIFCHNLGLFRQNCRIIYIIWLTSWERFEFNEKMTRFQFVKSGLISHFPPLPKYPVLISCVQLRDISHWA